MMRWLAKFFGRKENTQQGQANSLFPIPWEHHRQSLYRYLSPYAEGSEPLPEKAQTLPDEHRLSGELRWAAGAMDGAFGHHCGGAGAEDIADQLLDALGTVLEHPSLNNMQKLYTLLSDASPIDYIDSLMEKLPKTAVISPQKIRDLMQWLARESPDRNPVKCAIALLAYFPSEENKSIVTTLGLHDEFTLFSVVALTNLLPVEDHETALIGLAKRVTGWGRIQIIERLPDNLSPGNREWLLREGYSNSVMFEYTAWDCASKGELLGALTSGYMDTGLLIGAGEILSALILGGPARDISDYLDGAQACHHCLVLIRQSADDDFRHLLNAKTIGEFAGDKDRNWEVLEEQGWSDALRQKISEDAQAILAQPKWRNKIEKALAMGDNPDYVITRAAKILNIDVWDTLFASQSAHPDASHWYELMQTDSVIRIQDVLTLAESQLDLPAIASGPDGLLGLGPQYQQHSALDFILQDLHRFPGQGWTLIKTGLHSPVTRNRNMALNALESWSTEQRPAELSEFLTAAYKNEPDDNLRERLEKVLAADKV